jgi:chromosome segregation ATPase
VPRKRHTEHPELPFEEYVATPESTSKAAKKRAGSTGTRMGRPRKWESEAERKRAYRERLAADLAEPQRLRRELRNERKRVASRDQRIASLERELARVEARIDRHGERESGLERRIEHLESRVADWRSRARALAESLEKERKKTASAGSIPGVQTTLSPERKPESKPPPKRSRSKRRRRR